MIILLYGNVKIILSFPKLYDSPKVDKKTKLLHTADAVSAVITVYYIE
jgi:hypothetical protein